MNLVVFGKIVNTHGIKGELKLLSDFEYKERVLKPGFKLFTNNEFYTIKTYRRHKQFDMITLDGFDNINQVLFLKGKTVYIVLDDLRLDDEILTNDLIGFNVFDNDLLLGEVINVENNAGKILLLVGTAEKTFRVPKVDAFIKDINITLKRIELHHWEGLYEN